MSFRNMTDDICPLCSTKMELEDSTPQATIYLCYGCGEKVTVYGNTVRYERTEVHQANLDLEINDG